MEDIFEYAEYDDITEGESVLDQYFKQTGIMVEFQKEIPKLKGDEKSHRVADFYLPRLKIYVEFFGMWNVSDRKKEDYREKKRIYKENSIPCVYIYPENLGVIQYIFPYRVWKVLKNHNLRKQLIRFSLFIFLKKNGNYISVILAIFSVWFYYFNDLLPVVLLTLSAIIVLIYLAIITFNTIELIKNIRSIRSSKTQKP